MFTGIITGIGYIIDLQSLGTSELHGKKLMIQAPESYLGDVQSGDSIALNGACMTVTGLDKTQHRFSIDISTESLSKTAGLDQLNQPINLEKALRASDRLGGHIVSGHVDAQAQVITFEPQGESWQLTLKAPAHLAKYLAYKGSVAVNGVSLTLNQVNDQADHSCHISINLIPHTLQHTTLHQLSIGACVNLEIDTVARYCERMLGKE